MRENYYSYESVDSTNNVCKTLAMEGAPHGTVVTAKVQTAGKGRLGRSFQSPPSLGLYLSYLYRPNQDTNLLSLTPLCGIAAAKALEEVAGITPDLKWPNDLLLNSKKIGGILVEAITKENQIDAIIIGIGINVLHQRKDFEEELQGLASSLRMETGKTLDVNTLALAICKQLDVIKDSDSALHYYKEHCITLGKDVKIASTGEVVKALDIDASYGLVVEHSNKEIEVLRIGEVSVRGLYGYAE